MWDLLVLTAGSKNQKQNFEKILKTLPNIWNLVRDVIVIADEPEGVCIGSGGSTLVVLRKLKESYGEFLSEKKILLCHSGGFSKRMIHLSAVGKVFARLPNGKTVLETKLEHYDNHLLDYLPKGLMITASDVLEDMRGISENFQSELDAIIFAHQSSPKVGTQHGVFCLDTNSDLVRVLQKPTLEVLEKENAIRTNGTVLTDSCFWLSWHICNLLEKTAVFPISEELCCYGDFMRSMGSDPDLSYIKNSEQRQIFSKIFSSTKRIKIFDLGPTETFFHFGTYKEFLEHLTVGSEFQKVFNAGEFQNSEFCKLASSTEVPKTSFLSGVENGETTEVPSNSIIVTYPLKENLGFTTVVFDAEFDFKSIWDIKRFSAYPTRQKSFDAVKNGMPETGQYSLRDLTQLYDIDKHLEWTSNF